MMPEAETHLRELRQQRVQTSKPEAPSRPAWPHIAISTFTHKIENTHDLNYREGSLAANGQHRKWLRLPEGRTSRHIRQHPLTSSTGQTLWSHSPHRLSIHCTALRSFRVPTRTTFDAFYSTLCPGSIQARLLTRESDPTMKVLLAALAMLKQETYRHFQGSPPGTAVARKSGDEDCHPP